MQWRENGELAGGDLQALLARLHQVESREHAEELQQCLGRRAGEV